MHSLLPQVVKLNHQDNLFHHSQRIVVAVSGGADSTVLLRLLWEFNRAHQFDFELCAVHVALVSVTLPACEIETLRQYCADYTIPFHVLEEQEYEADQFDCYQCARERRKLLFQFAIKQGYETIAFGHNWDDFLETGLLNLIFHGTLESLRARQTVLDGALTVIRPILTIPKKHVLAYARLNQIPVTQKICPYARNSQRETVRQLIRNIKAVNRTFPKNLSNAITAWHQLNAEESQENTADFQKIELL